MEQHFQYWVFLTLLSVVSLTSLANLFDDESNKGDWSREQRWVFSVSAISLIMSFLACVFYMFFKEKFLGNKSIEVVWNVVVLAMWCAGLPALMDNENAFAVGGSMQMENETEAPVGGSMQRAISNSNLFFASWGALVVSVMLATSHFQIHFNRQDDKHLFHWVGFAASSFVVMCSTSRFWSDSCKDSGTDTPVCARAAFGVVLGAISFLVGGSIAWINIQLLYAQAVSIFFVATWCIAVAYLTFDEGPGVPLGSLYFGTWLSLLFVLAIAGPAVLQMVHSSMGTTEETSAVANDAGKDSPVDSKDGAVVGGEDAEEEEVAESA